MPKLVESIRDSNNDDVIKNVCGALANLASENGIISFTHIHTLFFYLCR